LTSKFERVIPLRVVELVIASRDLAAQVYGPHGFLCNAADEVLLYPMKARQRRGHFLFGSFQQFSTKVGT
jgi:hypothetical protein